MAFPHRINLAMKIAFPPLLKSLPSSWTTKSHQGYLSCLLPAGPWPFIRTKIISINYVRLALELLGVAWPAQSWLSSTQTPSPNFSSLKVNLALPSGEALISWSIQQIDSFVTQPLTNHLPPTRAGILVDLVNCWNQM
jgi:hypothetical protein